MTSVQLLGMKHTGKSTLGRLLAKERDLPFFDLDTLLETELAEKKNLSAREIYQTLGKPRFQELEAQAARKAASRMASQPLVLAWGGGTVENVPAREALRGKGVLVHLKESAEVLFERILRTGLPAFLSPDRPWEDFQSLYRERTLLLSKVCDVELDLNGKSVETALIALIGVLGDA